MEVAVALLVWVCRQRQQLDFVCDCPTKGKTVGICDDKNMRAFYQRGKLCLRPWALCCKRSRMKFGHLQRCHASNVGAGSRDGAASAALMYSGAGRGCGAPALFAAIWAI